MAAPDANSTDLPARLDSFVETLTLYINAIAQKRAYVTACATVGDLNPDVIDTNRLIADARSLLRFELGGLVKELRG